MGTEGHGYREGPVEVIIAMSDTRSVSWATRTVAAVLCVAVVVVHVAAQGGIPGEASPPYLRYGFYLLEIVGLVAAFLLLRPSTGMATWLLAFGVAAGPLFGYVLSRTVGLPDLNEKGDWTNPLGMASLVAEALLLVVAVAQLVRRGRSTRMTDVPARTGVTRLGAR
jgi:hypothetical protein